MTIHTQPPEDIDHYRRSALNYFAANPLDRMTVRRRDPEWLDAQLHADNTRIVPVWRSDNLFTRNDHNGSEPQRAVLLTPADATDLLHRADPVLLGSDEEFTYFAVDVSGEENGDQPPFVDAGIFVNLRTVRSAQEDPKMAALLAYAKAMTYWQERHRYCGDCGYPTESIEGGFVRQCTNPEKKHRHFPRTDPAIITLVQSEERALLARQPTWPPGRYSIIAGFIEPGESAEDAVLREVKEETNIEVGAVHYHSSQPWPFPSSLMMGYFSEAASTQIRLVDQELENARWFSREGVAEELRAGTLRLPPGLSISRRLIETWFNAGNCGPLAELTRDEW